MGVDMSGISVGAEDDERFDASVRLGSIIDGLKILLRKFTISYECWKENLENIKKLIIRKTQKD